MNSADLPDLDLTHFQLEVDRVGVATILFDRAGESMNTLAPEVLEDFEAVIARCESDPAIRALVVGSAKTDSFIAGGDIRWLNTLDEAAAATEMIATGHEVMARLERLSSERGKPVVAAIHGPCMGGGLEVALACSGRVATDHPSTRLGQPEVKIGLIPGAGGTQRLPRLIGIANGLDLILTGRTIRPAGAKRLGLIDELAPLDQLMATARRRAIEAIGKAHRGPGTRRHRISAAGRLRTLALERNPIGRRLLFRNAHRIMMRRTKGHYPAPPAALRAVRKGIEQGLEAGVAAEAGEFAGLLTSPEAKALMSIYFASQALKRDRGAGPEIEPRSVGEVGIVGGGLMGGGIASVNLIRAGVPTIIKEIDDAGVARTLAHVEGAVEAQAKRRRTSPSQIAAVEHLLSGTTDYADLSNADLVIEAVFEDLDLKRSVLAEVEAATREGTVFASNTSSIPISDIAAEAARPQDVIGMHYFSPVERMPLLEIVTTEATSGQTIATCVAFGKQQAKTVIVVNDGPGFFTTRVLAPYVGEVLHLLQDGARIEDIDSAMVDWGFPVGPITLSDEVGIDVGAKIGVIMQQAFGDRMRAPQGYAALIEDGRKGRKNERGFYRYKGGKRSGVDASVYELLGVSPTGTVSREEIQSRLSAQMVNEAARCLEEGVLRSARDGDIGAVMGLGFPPFRGGPFFYIDQTGAEAFVASLDALAAAHGPRFEAAPILREYAATGRAIRS